MRRPNYCTLSPEQLDLVNRVFNAVRNLDIVAKDNENDPDMIYECDIDLLQQDVNEGYFDLFHDLT